MCLDESPVSDFCSWRDKPYVGPYFLGSADTVECPILKYPQEMALHGERHVADLVKEQRASLGDLDLAGLPLGGSGERALFVSKELVLQQVLREGGAIDGNKRFRGARAPTMNGAGDHFFSCTRFAE